MKRIYYLIIVLLIALGVTTFLLQDNPLVARFKMPRSVSSEETGFSQQQVIAIEKIVYNYLLNNPEIIIELDKKLQEQEVTKQKTRIENTKEKIEEYKLQLFDEKLPGKVTLGNPMGEVTIVEFTQHPC